MFEISIHIFFQILSLQVQTIIGHFSKNFCHLHAHIVQMLYVLQICKIPMQAKEKTKTGEYSPASYRANHKYDLMIFCAFLPQKS